MKKEHLGMCEVPLSMHGAAPNSPMCGTHCVNEHLIDSFVFGQNMSSEIFCSAA